MRRPNRPAFTLVELLVVIGILIALIAILLPAVNKAYKNAQRTSMQADIAAISQALDAYRNDFADYPRIDVQLFQVQRQYPGAVLLCWALVAPGPAQPSGGGTITGADGADGPGFRVRGTQGTVHPSYLNLDRFKLGVVTATGVTPANTTSNLLDSNCVILDHFNKPVLYFPANKTVQVTKPTEYLGPSPYPGVNTVVPTARFNANDAQLNTLFTFTGNGSTLTGAQAMLRLMPGVITPPGGGTQTVNTAEVTTLPFLLWSAGPDGQFGSDDDATNIP